MSEIDLKSIKGISTTNNCCFGGSANKRIIKKVAICINGPLFAERTVTGSSNFDGT